jgi:hypothetical protein
MSSFGILNNSRIIIDQFYVYKKKNDLLDSDHLIIDKWKKRQIELKNKIYFNFPEENYFIDTIIRLCMFIWFIYGNWVFWNILKHENKDWCFENELLYLSTHFFVYYLFIFLIILFFIFLTIYYIYSLVE